MNELASSIPEPIILEPVIASVGCQLDKIWNHCGDKHSGTPVRVGLASGHTCEVWSSLWTHLGGVV